MQLSSTFTIAVAGAVLFSFTGCGEQAAKKGGGTASGHEHDHPSEGPHKGVLVELGNDEYHGEVVHDDAANKVTVYVLDSKAMYPVPIADKEVKINVVAKGAPAQFVLSAAPLDGEKDGKSSRFELVDQKLIDALDAEGVEARLKLNIDGTPYEGKIAAHEHEH